MKQILVLNGPNLNMLGIREPEVYGSTTYDKLKKMIKAWGTEFEFKTRVRQSNCEGKLITWIQKAYKKYDGIIINPGAYTHTSIAISDAIRAVSLPTVEVHISDIDSREEYRKISYISCVCIGVVKGQGITGYKEAMVLLKKYLLK